jgi:hypothetical protein
MANIQKILTPETAARHEALYLRLSTLLRQTEAGANKRADAPVGDITRRLAEDLLFEARHFTCGPKAIPAAAPDLVGLAAQLGQALAALDAFEASHSCWHPELDVFVWSVNGAPRPIARLRPKTQEATHPDTAAALAILRQRVRKLAENFDQHVENRVNAAAAAGPKSVSRW